MIRGILYKLKVGSTARSHRIEIAERKITKNEGGCVKSSLIGASGFPPLFLYWH